jgi:hypothetical protein
MEFRCHSCNEINAVGEDKIPLTKEGAFWVRFIRITSWGLTMLTLVGASQCSVDNYFDNKHLEEVMKAPGVKFEYEKRSAEYPSLKIKRD